MEPVIPKNQNSVAKFSVLNKKVGDAIVDLSERKVTLDTLTSKIKATLDLLTSTQAKLHMILKLIQNCAGVNGGSTMTRLDLEPVQFNSSTLLDEMTPPVRVDGDEAEIQMKIQSPVANTLNNNVQQQLRSSSFPLSDDFHSTEIVALLQEIETLSKLFRCTEAANMNLLTNLPASRQKEQMEMSEDKIPKSSTEKATSTSDDTTIAHILTFTDVDVMSGSCFPGIEGQSNVSSVEHEGVEGVKRVDEMLETKTLDVNKLNMSKEFDELGSSNRTKTVSCSTHSFTDSSTSTNITLNTKKQVNEYPRRKSNKFYWRASVNQKLKQNPTPLTKFLEVEPHHTKQPLRKIETKILNQSTKKYEKKLQDVIKDKHPTVSVDSDVDPGKETKSASTSNFENFFNSMKLDFKIKGLTTRSVSENMSATFGQKTSKDKIERQVRLHNAYLGPTHSGKSVPRSLKDQNNSWDKKLEQTSQEMWDEMKKVKQRAANSNYSTLKYGNFKKIIKKTNNEKLQKTLHSQSDVDLDYVKGRARPINKIQKKKIPEPNNSPILLAAGNSNTKNINQSDTSETYSTEKIGNFSNTRKTAAAKVKFSNSLLPAILQTEKAANNVEMAKEIMDFRRIE